MKTNIVTFVVVIVIIVGGYLIFSKREAAAPVTTQEAQQEEKKMAFDQFIEQGKGSYRCTVRQQVQGQETVGTVYVQDSKVRGEFNTKVQGTNVDTTFVVKDGYSYTWSSAMPSVGFKTKVALPEAQTGGATSGTYSFNANTIGDYDCVEQVIDESRFAIPSITFTEVKQ